MAKQKVDDNAFYYRPDLEELGFHKSAVGVNTLSTILPNMCKGAGLKLKTSHCLGVTCATALFQKGVEDKLIRQRTGHRSNALLKYETACGEQVKSVSDILGPVSSKKVSDSREDCESDLSEINYVQNVVNLDKPVFNNCNVTF